ncbi:SDR family oxidoreductase [Streptomyces flavidovirens]|uniref:SDR family NAD(P)-dependent oxidoreductase n=1 Tax=Streptomyces flavidovirens TaxID=67298 RepID=UPI0034397FD6
MTRPVSLGLHGRCALVTGGGAGIGRAVARALGEAGAAVAVVDIVAHAAGETARDLVAAGHRAVAVTADVTDARQAGAAVEETVRELGGLDIAVNNVGMLAGHRPHPFVAWSPAATRDVVANNLHATVYSCQAEARAMIAHRRGGVIINVSSGEATRPAPGMAVYGAAKAAVNHLTRTLAVELAPHGIRVNAVAPGTTLTRDVEAGLPEDYRRALIRSIPLGALSEPGDLAALVLLLASDLAAHTTGQFLLADNGAFLSRNRPELPLPAEE